MYNQLIEDQSLDSKKQFSILVTYVCMLQTILMLYSAERVQQMPEYRQLFFKDGKMSLASQIIIICIIIALPAGRLFKPAKKPSTQVCIQILISAIWVLLAAVISSILGIDYWFYYAFALIYNVITYFCAILAYMSIMQTDKKKIFRPFAKRILIFILSPIGTTLFLSLLANGATAFKTLLPLLIFGIVGIIWCTTFGFGFLRSLGQLNKGKFKLKENDFTAGATLVYGNMVAFCW